MNGWPDADTLRLVADRLNRLRTEIDQTCRRVGRHPAEVTLVGACKRQPLSRIAAAVAAGLNELGENYVQETESVRPALEALLKEQGVRLPRWRMIGHLQRNKARDAVNRFDTIDSIDRIKLAVELNKRSEAEGRTLDVGFQIALSAEEQKAGIRPEEAPALLEACRPLESLRVIGLMTLPSAEPKQARIAFRQLRELRDTLQQKAGGESLKQLSMGMSGDFKIAIEEGATHVRIGSALFGDRTPR